MKRQKAADRFDADIRSLIERGLTCNQISRQLQTYPRFCRERAEAIGCSDHLRANGLSRSIRVAAHAHTRGGRSAKFVQARSRTDRSATDLIHSIRRRRPIADVATDHALACLHLRGLTLPDIETCFGIPPVKAAAAIRRAML